MIERLMALSESILVRDPAAKSKWEVLFLYPAIRACCFYHWSQWFYQRERYFVARWVTEVGRRHCGIEIHPGATIGKDLFIDHGMGVVIGETAEIGDDVTLYHGVTLGGTTWSKGKRHPTLEDGVVVGAGAKILGPFTVHKGAKVGSNAVVTKEVPEGVTAVGNPARYIKDKTQIEPEEANRRDYAESIGFQPYAATQEQSDPILEGIRVLLDRMQQNEKRINTLCQRLSLLDPTFKPQNSQNKDFSPAELEIIEELKRECEAQSSSSNG